jgi:hypothetical protein
MSKQKKNDSVVIVDESPFKELPLEPRVVTKETVRWLKDSGAAPDLIEVAERAVDESPQQQPQPAH